MILFPDTFTAELLSIFSRYAQIIAEFFWKVQMNSKICSVCCFLSTSQRTDVFRLSVQISVHVGKLNLRSAYHGFLRQECHVWCQQCIFRMKQRFLCGNGRLTVKYIHRSSCDPSFVQSLCQCLAVYTFSFGCSFLHFSVQYLHLSAKAHPF